MSAELTLVPKYRDVVRQDQWLERTRTEINPKSLGLLGRVGLEGVVRGFVPDRAVAWDVSFADYQPTHVDQPYGLITGRDMEEVDERPPAPSGEIKPFSIEQVLDRVPSRFISWELRGLVQYDERGFPRHPVGRTGIDGRLTMNRYGPTFAVDAIVIDDLGNNVKPLDWKILVVVRTDNNTIALPAGKIDEGETPRQALRRETKEETGFDFDFSDARLVFLGAVDDDRNADGAWFETAAVSIKARGSSKINPKAEEDDVVRAQWMTARDILSSQTHASTELFIRLALGIS